jgi:subtilisin family serine protease
MRRLFRRRSSASTALSFTATVLALIAASSARAVGVIPNDPYFPLQWGLFNTGQTILGDRGRLGIDAHLPEAWTVTTGSRAIKVAIIDSGIDATHPDLAANVDVADGANFEAPGQPPTDTRGHGTAVAGIIGAVGNNRLGVTGVNWQVSMFAEKVPLGIDGSSPQTLPAGSDPYAMAIEDAVAKGARVVNMSFGGGSPDPAVDSAMAAAPNTLFVVAAGNFGSAVAAANTFPCAPSPGAPPVTNKLCVTAIDDTGHLPLFYGNFSPTLVDLAAPAHNLATTMPPGVTLSGESNGRGYGYFQGTSAAVPMVSGAAALILSHDPSLNGAALRQLIMSTVQPDSAMVGKTVSGGILDVGRALGVAPEPRPQRNPRDQIFTFSVAKSLEAPAQSQCVAGNSLVLRVRDQPGHPIQTAVIAITDGKPRTVSPPKLERPITLHLPPRKRITISIMLVDTRHWSGYGTLRYRRC